jgi:hypothetical protein
VSTDRSVRLLPLLEKCLWHLLLQMVCGLLPGLTSAIAHLHRVLARALDIGFLGVDSSGEQEHACGDKQMLHRGLPVLPEGYGGSLALATIAAPRVSMNTLTRGRPDRFSSSVGPFIGMQGLRRTPCDLCFFLFSYFCVFYKRR